MLRLILLLLVLIATPAAAVEISAEQMRACQAMEDSTSRLRCYDELANATFGPRSGAVAPAPTASAKGVAEGATVVGAPAASAGVTEAVAEPASVRVGDQGEDQTDQAFGRRAERGNAPASILAVIERTDKTAYGKMIFYLANDQVWQQLDSLRSTLRAGDEVQISSAMSGSFLLRKSSGGTSIRVRRLER